MSPFNLNHSKEDDDASLKIKRNIGIEQNVTTKRKILKRKRNKGFRDKNNFKTT